jgi:hypothetical protein
MATHYLHRIGPDGNVLAQTSAGFKIDLPGVERADHLAITNNAVGKWTATMWAGIIRGKEATITLTKNRNRGFIHHKRTTFTEGNKSNRPKVDPRLYCVVMIPMGVHTCGKGSAAPPHTRASSPLAVTITGFAN